MALLNGVFMFQNKRILFLLLLIFVSLAACSLNSQKREEAALSAVLPQMVIKKSDFDRDYKKFCSHTRECSAPLTCLNKQCVIPPSISGISDDQTPKLSFKSQTGEHVLSLEIANDEYTMQLGLMMRKVCLPDWGMLFVYSDEARRAFWMHNTYIPLDMVFIRADGSVSNVVKNAEPLNDIPRYLSTDRVKYVLEIAAGQADRFGIASGTQFDVKGF